MDRSNPVTDLFELRTVFDGGDLRELAMAYRRSPAELYCPTCRPGRMEIAGFVEPQPDRRGFALPAEPTGCYVVLLRCHGCGREGHLVVEEE